MQSTRPAEFIALIAFLTALMAMSIDTMLPGTGIMAEELGAAHPNDQQLIILGFFAGNMVGTPIFGPLSDSVGRKPAIYMSLAVYVLGSFLCMMSGIFWVLVLGRIVQGIGASGPRTVALAMVRDGAKGADMARIMSFVMSVFMLVPIIAPFIGQKVLDNATWRYIFGGLMVAAVIAWIWVATRQPETLAVENRQPFSAAKMIDSASQVFNNRIAFGYTLATGFVFSIFTAYLGVCRQLWAEQYHQGELFAYWFGGFAVFIGLAMITNGGLVRKHGMRKLSQRAMVAYIAAWAIILLLSLMFNGQPPMLVMAALFAVWFFSAGFTFGNFNAMAMEPMGHIAGMAAAISGAISTGMAIILGGIAGRLYDGTMTSLAAFFTAYAVCCLLSVEWAEKGRQPMAKPALDRA